MSGKREMRKIILGVLCFALFLGGCAGNSRSNGKKITDGYASSNPSELPPLLSTNSSTDSPTPPFSGMTTAESPSKEEIPTIAFKKEGDGGTLAVWWWDARILKREKEKEAYLEFLKKNSVNTVYLCYPDFPQEEMVAFVRLARQQGMSVCLLSGDSSFINKDSAGAREVVEKYLLYQQSVPQDARFEALHLDVEPHQREDFNENRQQILQLYAEYVEETAEIVRGAGEKLEWDIPFWFDDYRVINSDGEEQDLLSLLCDNADTLCLMSYRDTAQEILAVSEKEIVLCAETGCKVVCGVETHSAEGDHVSFMEEGKGEMYVQMGEVYGELCRRMGQKNFGMAVHYLDTWYALKD